MSCNSLRLWEIQSIPRTYIEKRFLSKQITSLLNQFSRSFSFQLHAVFKGWFSGCNDSTCHSATKLVRRCSWLINYLEQPSMKPWSQKNHFKCFLDVRDPWPHACLKITPERLEQLQRSTGPNETLQTLKTSILTGWPMQTEEVPIKICEYWSYSDDLTIHNGVLFKGSTVVIPKLLRPEIKSPIHSSHLGVEAQGALTSVCNMNKRSN